MFGLGLFALALGGIIGPLTPRIRLEARYASIHVIPNLTRLAESKRARDPSSPSNTGFRLASPSRSGLEGRNDNTIPAVFNPLAMPDGTTIEPADKEFGLIIPKIGVNAEVISNVNPNKPSSYQEALKHGIAHSSLSYLPDQDGTVYLFSHSTNYDWFVKDLNAVFYLIKNLEKDDMVVLMYKGSPYTYKITGKQIVKPTDVSYMAPQAGAKRLILQTCWPPGSTSERLLIFADLMEETQEKI